MDFCETDIWKRIGDGEAFRDVLATIRRKDRFKAQEISAELQEVLDRPRVGRRSVGGEKPLSRAGLWERRSAVLQEMINVKAHVKRYSECIALFADKEAELRRQAPEVADDFFDQCLAGLDLLFKRKELGLHADIDAEVTWTTEPRDRIRSLVRGVADLSGQAAERLETTIAGFDRQWSDKSRNLLRSIEVKTHEVRSNIDSETTLNQIWNRHMAKESAEITAVLHEAWQKYERQWGDLEAYKGVSRDQGFCLAESAASLNAKPGKAANPAMRVGGAGAFVGAAATVSLAMGWHTLSYAVFHVFPPAMVFSLLAAAWTGKHKEESYRSEIKNQFSRCLHLIRQDYVQIWFEGSDPEGQQAPLRTEVMRDAAARVEASLQAWQRRLFGQLDVGDYIALVQSFETQLALLETGLTQLDDLLGSLSRERDEYPKIIEDFSRRYPGLDEESLGMLATGEVLLQMHIEQPFYECSPIALPFTKVLERELYRVFRDQFGQPGGMVQEKEQKFMLGAFLAKVRCAEIKGAWRSDFLDNLSVANLVRCSMAHRDPISFERAMKLRDLVVGQQGLLREILAMGH